MTGRAGQCDGVGGSVIIALAASLALPAQAGAQALREAPVPAPALTGENVAAFFDAAFQVQRRDHEMVGAVVSVVRKGAVLFQRGYGWADLERRIPADPERSLFRIASITKTFVWTALMQLVEQGRVELDADVNRYIDFEIPSTYDEPIRVRHLMSHTPGFEETWTGWGARTPDDVGELGASLEALLPARVRPPGRHAAYSNYGAALAGYIVEQVSGQPWDQYVEEHILEPLGMRSTNARTVMSPDLEARHAAGYRYRGGEFVATDYAYMQLGPAGLMSSTAADMATFMLAHLGHGAIGGTRILQEGTSRLMQSPLFAPHPDLPPILHGFIRSDRNGQVVFGHGGDTNQFHSNMSLIPRAELGVFVSFNTDPSAVARGNLMLAFLDHFFPSEYLRPAPEPAGIDLADYAGTYLPLRSPFSNFERLRILSMGRSMRPDGEEVRFGGDTRWIPLAPDRFTGLYEDRVIVFERDDEGNVTHLLAGSPLASFRRVRGLGDPRVLQSILIAVVLICLATVLGYGYRAFRQAPEPLRLPTAHVRTAWLHALLLGALLLALPESVGSAFHGAPAWLKALFLAFNGNLALGLIVVFFSARQWTEGYGTPWSRMRFSLLALASAFILWFAGSFNLVGYVG